MMKHKKFYMFFALLLLGFGLAYTQGNNTHLEVVNISPRMQVNLKQIIDNFDNPLWFEAQMKAEVIDRQQWQLLYQSTVRPQRPMLHTQAVTAHQLSFDQLARQLRQHKRPLRSFMVEPLVVEDTMIGWSEGFDHAQLLVAGDLQRSVSRDGSTGSDHWFLRTCRARVFQPGHRQLTELAPYERVLVCHERIEVDIPVAGLAIVDSYKFFVPVPQS